eukprot:8775952-Lingulodinium_polyedra.AAC.1
MVMMMRTQLSGRSRRRGAAAPRGKMTAAAATEPLNPMPRGDAREGGRTGTKGRKRQRDPRTG